MKPDVFVEEVFSRGRPHHINCVIAHDKPVFFDADEYELTQALVQEVIRGYGDVQLG